MKKQKLKNYLKFGILLFGISIILTNCEKDDDFESLNLSTSKPIPAVKTINFNEFLNQKTSRITLEKLNELNNKSSKTSSNNNKDSDGQPQTITIDSTSIKQIIKDGTISYTFKIVQDSINNTFFENLIIQTDSLQETSAYVIKYIPETDYDINNPFQGVREITPIDSNVNINTSNSKTTVCVTVITYVNHYLCDPGVEQTPENCDYQYTEELYDTTCTSTGGGGGYNNTGTYTIPSGTSSGGGGGSSSSDPTDPNYDPTDPDIHGNGSNNLPILTSPIDDVQISNNPHIQSLNNQTNNTKVKNKITALQTVVNSTLNEDGMQFDLIANSNPIDFNEVEPLADQTGTDHIKFPDVRPETLVNLHLHPKYGLIEGIGAPQELSPIFSDGDVYFMLEFFEDTNNNEDISSLIVSAEGVFALRVTDANRATFMKNKLDINRFWKRYLDDFKEEVLNSEDGEPPYTNQQIIDNFINFLNTYQINNNDNGQGFGLSLFQATLDTNGNITGWTQP